jgi:internalin A
MESCGVCFRCSATADGEPRYVAPDLLPGYRAGVGGLQAWHETPGTPTLRLEYRFFHQAVIRGLMSDIGRQAGDLAEYWKYGFWLQDDRHGAQLLVQFHDTSTSVAPASGALELKAQGRDPLGLLRQIRSAVLQQPIGEQPDETLTLNGKTVTHASLAAATNGQMLDLPTRSVHVSPLARVFADPERASEARSTDGPPPMGIVSRALTAAEKEREVFISYAHGDNSPQGRVRERLVEELYGALERDGFVPVRDRDQISPGDLISPFIRRLTRADCVVAVISDRYLRSRYCMHELFSLWQRFRGDPDDLAQHLVPIVLPEVKLANSRERLPYISHWVAEATNYEELALQNMKRLSPESLQEFCQIRDLAQHVDSILVYINDILMPRQLQAHLDDGFQAVRDALRRRLKIAPQQD